MLEQRNRIRYLLMLGIFVLMNCFPFAQHAWAIRNAENSNVQGLLFQVRGQAFGLDQDAQTMEALMRSDVNWQEHAEYLDSVAEHVNRMSQILAELQSARETASPEQQIVIDRVTPLLREIAANTTNAVNYLSRNQDRPLLIGEYPTWLRENAEAAHELSQLVSNIVEYRQTSAKLQQLEAQLNLK
jgi:hypothetical protein